MEERSICDDGNQGDNRFEMAAGGCIDWGFGQQYGFHGWNAYAATVSNCDEARAGVFD